jgi:hypothetical protein
VKAKLKQFAASDNFTTSLVYNQKRMCGDDNGSSACGRETVLGCYGRGGKLPFKLGPCGGGNRRIATDYKLRGYDTVRRRPVAENRSTNG